MKKNKTKNKVKNAAFFSVMNMVTAAYLFIMLGFFPVYYRYQYADMGNQKYNIFMYSTTAFVLVSSILLLIQLFLQMKAKGVAGIKKEYKLELSILDVTVAVYFICTTVSYLLCGFKSEGFMGAGGWNMGYLSQLLFVGSYILISRAWKYQEGYLWLLLASSAIVFFVAVLHRFDIDIFGIYGSLEEYYKVQFLSTMGQSSWYSSFLCTIFPVGLYLFFISDSVIVRRISCGFSVLAMLSLVTQNTDSAFICLAAVLFLLFYLAFDGRKRMLRFMEVLILVFGSFTFMGFCQRIFADHMIPIDSLSIFMSQGVVSPLITVIVLALYLWRRKAKVVGDKEYKRTFFWILTGFGAALCTAGLIFIVLNSNGFLSTNFGYQNENNYLLFTDEWGNMRGFAWRFTCEAYAQQPLLQKLVGVGPDCYVFYNMSIPELAQQVTDFWGELSLTNAHNEYLTKLYNLGIFGLVSYVAMLGSAVYIFIKNRTEHILLPAFALCTVSYMAHLIFCYEQVCCTPVFYILMGFGSNLIYNKEWKSTY